MADRTEPREVRVRILSTINGEDFVTEAEGLYTRGAKMHHLKYRDRTEDGVTQHALHFGESSLMLRRGGVFSGTMVFHPEEDTDFRYKTYLVDTAFTIHTYEYLLDETPERLRIRLSYGLRDDAGGEIPGRQVIEIYYV